MGRSELPVPVNEYLGSEHEVQIPDVDYLDVRNKHFFVYKKKKDIYIYIYTHTHNKMKDGISIQINNKVRKQYEPTSRCERGQGISPANQLPRTRTKSSAKFLLESGRHDISRTRVSLTFE